MAEAAEQKREIGKMGAGTPWTLVALLAFGLTMTDLWCDLLGHSPATAAANDLVAGALTNGRVLWNLALVVCCPLMVAFPKAMERMERTCDAALPLVAAALVAAYPLLPGMGDGAMAAITAAIVVTGFCYGWMEVRLLAECARLRTFAPAFWAIAVSQAVKVPLTVLVGSLPHEAQTSVDALAAASLLPVFVLLRRGRDDKSINAAIEPGRIPIPAADQSSVLTLLVLLPVMNSVARALSNLAFWGGAHVVDGSGLLAGIAGPVVFLLVVAITFARLRDERIMGRLFVALVVILGGIVLFDADVMARAGFPQPVIDTLVSATELYSHHLFWVVAVVAIRTVDWHPYRLAALTELSMSAVAFAFGLLLQSFSGLSRFLVNGALYAVVVIALALLWHMRAIAVERPASEPGIDAACGRVASTYSLTPRESQVLLLLAQSRSRVFIQDELGLSDSTIKAHTAHIYQKLSVHSKQEVISLVRERG